MTASILRSLSVMLLSASLVIAADRPAPSGDQTPSVLHAAIFVQNNASADFQKYVNVLNDLVTTRLTEKGFSILDKDIVVSAFRDASRDDDPVRREQQTKVSSLKVAKTEATVEGILSSASALRLSQMLGADYIIVATINSAGREKRSFKGKESSYGVDLDTTMYTLRIALKVLEGKQGGSVYGDTVTATEKVAHTDTFESDSTDTINKLLDTGAILIADNVTSKIGRIRDSKPTGLSMVAFAVNSNIEGADVELDGAAIGAAPGRFSATPGLHQIRITREWFATWEKTINIYSNQALNVTMELSDEGRKRFKDTESFKLTMAKSKQDMELEKTVTETKLDVLKEQSEAEAYSKRRIAEGEKKKREQSYVHDDGIGNEIKKIIHGGD